jgi:NADPH:quinone reductase
MSQSLPLFMRAVALKAFDGRPESMSVVKKPVPRPGLDEVLVRVAAAPINPSDVLFVRGRHGRQGQMPVTPGMECSGVVVDSGGVLGSLLMGRRVACLASGETGSWAEYVTANVTYCVPLRGHVSDEQGATSIVIPLTAWALVQSLKKGRHRAAAQTAAAGSLAQVVRKLAEREGIGLVNIVRRPEQVRALHAAGAEHVLNSSDAGFDAECARLFASLKVSVAFDAVAGEMTNRLLRALPRGGKVTVFGSLSDQPCQIDPDQLIFDHKEVDGFWLSDWFPTGFQGGQSPLLLLSSVFEQGRGSSVKGAFPLEQIREAAAAAAEGLSGGKVLLVPGGKS